MITKKRLKGYLNTSNIVNCVLIIYLILFPTFSSRYATNNYISFFYQILLASSMVLIWGYCGIFSFGQAAFFGIGGYSYTIISMNCPNNYYTPLALLGAVAIGFGVAWLLGYMMFYGKINDSFLGVITLCFSMVCCTFMQQTAGDQWKIGEVYLSGNNGINGIPALQFGKITISGNLEYYLVLLVLILVYGILILIRKKPIGYSLIGIRENATRSSLLGYNTEKIKTMVFAFGGAIAAFAGVIYTTWGGFIDPTSMSMTSSTIPVVLAATGGRKNPTAVFVFSLIYLKMAQKLAANGAQYSNVLLGFLLLLVILLVPNGVFQELFRFIDKKIFRIDGNGY